jgi:DNA-binding CsgD family transcriptional regulator
VQRTPFVTQTPEGPGGICGEEVERVWPFEGRQSELALLRSAFAASAVDAVLVTAPAGLGKTRLAREAISTLGAARAVWVAATRSAAAIPFGAVAPLLPDSVACGSSVEVVRATGRQVAGWGGRPRVAIVVDDAHLLDDASATLIAHLARERLAFLLMNARAGEPIADALLQLVKDGHGDRMALSVLPDAAVDKLIDHSAADIDASARRRLRRTAAGNPLALRELLHGAQPGGLIELVTSRLDSLGSAVRFVVELVACGEPLPVPILRRLVGLDALAHAEDTGLVVAERSGRRRQARLDHPLYGEILRSHIGVSRLMRAHAALADALLATPMRRRDDALLAAVWQVEAGLIKRPEVLRAGALTAVGRGELQVAERLARAACQAEAGSEAGRLLAEILTYRGRATEAGQVLAAAPPPSPAERVAWTITRAETRYWSDGDLKTALATLDTVGEHALARASRSWLLLFNANCVQAASSADSVRTDPDAEPKALIWAAAAGCAACGFLGQHTVADLIHQQGAELAAAHVDILPWGVVAVDTGMCLAQLACGQPTAAQSISVAGYRTAVEGGAAMMVSGWALCGGLAALARGHLEEADRLLAEAQPAFAANDTFRLSRCCLAARAAVAALAGDRNAHLLMAKADALANPSNKVFNPWIESWRAWTAYASGDLAAAATAAHRAADLAREAAMPAVEALARYDLTRLGAGGDSARLDGIDHELGDIIVRATQALAARDGAAELEGAARALQRHGYDLLAAELYAMAGHRHRRHQRWVESDLVNAYAVDLSAAFPNARTPLLQPGALTTVLTFRERQILLLAVEHTSAEIAERLQLATATVNNNLARAYHKLGINGRAQLRDLLDGAAGAALPQ